MIDFYSVTVPAFSLALEDICEDYGQMATYRGRIPEWPHHFDLDDHHRFFTGEPILVCGDTATMLQQTRYGAYFTVTGDRSLHFGPFDCRSSSQKVGNGEGSGGVCC